MAWTTPKTWATNELVTAALMNEQLRDNMNFLRTLVPAGTIVPYAGSTAPTGWVICDGHWLDIALYPDLYAAIGATYGGTSTGFALPDLRGRFPLGADNMGGTSANRVTATQADNLGQGAGEENHTLSIAEMPAHTHVENQSNDASSGISGFSTAKYRTGSGGSDTRYLGTGNAVAVFADLSTNSTGGGGAHNNMPPYMTVNYIIKA